MLPPPALLLDFETAMCCFDAPDSSVVKYLSAVVLNVSRNLSVEEFARSQKGLQPIHVAKQAGSLLKPWTCLIEALFDKLGDQSDGVVGIIEAMYEVFSCEESSKFQDSV